ncbi:MULTISPECIES: hypothetical protein [unclassified Bradyrhizobium]|uniref:hypothetical protein n=1 Tax=unclassified Bradyrhizobium TaxID=2631580 RepID=UPI002915D020|nr:MULTISPECIES: hypothetical protein [unclassified Bradyrhizobium]
MAKWDHDDLRDKTPQRETFVVPEGYEAERDSDGRATGKVRPRGSDVQPQTPAGVRAFGTGATRDLDANKLDFEGFLSPRVLERYAEHMHRARKMPDGSMRASDNWQLGIPVDVYMKSMWRHFFAVWKLHRDLPVTEVVNGVEVVKDLETELCALSFNVNGMLHEILKAKQQ